MKSDHVLVLTTIGFIVGVAMAAYNEEYSLWAWVGFIMFILSVLVMMITISYKADLRTKRLSQEREKYIGTLEAEIAQLKEERYVRINLDSTYRWARQNEKSTEAMVSAMMYVANVDRTTVLRYLEEYQGYNPPYPTTNGPITVVKRDINAGDRV
jgi:4-amino-4-deoxy-L-arabinose transferase-like glycosyltransferase